MLPVNVLESPSSMPTEAVSGRPSGVLRSMGFTTLYRILSGIVLIWLVGSIAFVMEALTPGSPADEILGSSGTPAQYAALNSKLGLNKPFVARYWQWLDGVLHGNLGTSLFTGQNVIQAIDARIGVTVSLTVGALILITVFGIPLGVLGAVSRGWVARLLQVIQVIGLALPSFWVVEVLISLLAVKVRIFPAIGYVGPSASIGGWLRSLTLPVVALSLGGITGLSKQTREKMREVLREEWVSVLLANGVSRRSVVWKHALRNAAVPVTTVLGVLAAGLLGATVLIEGLLNIPGMGSLTFTAVEQHDFPMIDGVAMYYAALITVIFLVLDFVYLAVNPTVRNRAPGARRR